MYLRLPINKGNNMSKLTINDIEFASRSAAARHYSLDPKLVNERVTKFGWSLAQAVGAESRPSKAHSKPVEINGVSYNSVSEAAKALGMAKTTLARKLKSGDEFNLREPALGRFKPMYYNGDLYPSACHLLLDHFELMVGFDVEREVRLLKQKAYRAKVKGETLGLSLDDVSEKFGVDKLRYTDEFDAWIDMVTKQAVDAELVNMFYYYEL